MASSQSQHKHKHKPFKTPILIAMKGHPCTGKSTIARSLSSSLKIPLIDKDDIRDPTFTLQHHHTLDPSLLNLLSYDILFNLASTQLSLGLSLVIDSPLSRKLHFDRTVEIASKAKARVVVVECRPSDEGEWRRRVERRGEEEGKSWHKPATWRDMEKLIEGYDGCFEFECEGVPKLVVDTTVGDKSVDEVVRRVLEFVCENCGDEG